MMTPAPLEADKAVSAVTVSRLVPILSPAQLKSCHVGQIKLADTDVPLIKDASHANAQRRLHPANSGHSMMRPLRDEELHLVGYRSCGDC